MYSHYMSGSFAPLKQESPRQQATRPSGRTEEPPRGGLSEMLMGLTKQFSLQHLDAGDILLILIILFLFLEGDNLEMVITLGLLLLFGLKDGQEGL